MEKRWALATDSKRLENQGPEDLACTQGRTAPSARLSPLVGDYEVRVDLKPVADAGAGCAGAVGVIEAEGAGLQLAQADVAMDAGELLGEEQLLAAHHRDQHNTAGHPDGGLHRVGHPSALGAVAYHQPVHHDLDGVPLLLVQVECLGEVVDLAVDADPDEAGLARLLEDLFVFALAATHHGRHDLDAAALGQVQDGVDDLLDGLPLDGAAAFVAVGRPDTGEEQAEVVVYLGDRADGGARVVRDASLVDGDGWGEALDMVDVGLVHTAEELPGVGREGLDVAALALGVDGVEGQGALARARNAGNDHQLVAGDGDVYVLEVVLAGAANNDVLQRHFLSLTAVVCVCFRSRPAVWRPTLIPS